MENDTLLFLDFDGVICDSLPETLVSSWLAYYKYIRGESPTAMPLAFKKKFAGLRPFIRTGEDYILLQDILFTEALVENQEDFDRMVKETDKTQRKFHKEIFYKARQDLLDRDPRYWFSLNPLFPAMKEALKKQPNERVFVLSTKKKEFIQRIFAANGIDFMHENILESGNFDKDLIIRRILDQGTGRYAMFIDDQISHLISVKDDRIKACLASWGYVKSEWLKGNKSVSVLSLEKAAAIIRFI